MTVSFIWYLLKISGRLSGQKPEQQKFDARNLIKSRPKVKSAVKSPLKPVISVNEKAGKGLTKVMVTNKGRSLVDHKKNLLGNVHLASKGQIIRTVPQQPRQVSYHHCVITLSWYRLNI